MEAAIWKTIITHMSGEEKTVDIREKIVPRAKESNVKIILVRGEMGVMSGNRGGGRGEGRGGRRGGGRRRDKSS